MKDRKNMVMIIVIAVTIILFLFFNTTVFATTGTITASDLRLRKEATTSSGVLAMLDENEKVEILDEDGDWYKIKAQGKVGYVYKKYVKTSKDTANNANTTSETPTSTNTTNNSSEATNTANTPNKIQSEGNTTSNIDNTVNNNENANNNITESNNNANNEASNNSNQLEVINSEKKNDATTIKEGTISVDSEIRVMPFINGDVISNIKSNEKVTVLSNVGMWSFVKNESKSGWILTNKISINENNVDAGNDANKPVEVGNKEDENKNQVDQVKEENQNKQDEQKKEETKKEESSTEILYSSTKKYYVKGTSVNARSKPNKSSESVVQLDTNDEVKVIGEDGDWYIIERNGKKLYIAKSLLSSKKVETTSRNNTTVAAPAPTPTPEPTPAPQQNEAPAQSSSGLSGDAVVAYAKGFLGYRYVYGTNGPNTFDCSGFVQYVYKHFGISLSRSSKTQANDGVYVSKDNLQPGDILIFKNTAKTEIGHVGLYIGGGQFIHASSSKTGVIISSLSSASYQQRYVSARRVIK